MESCLLPSSQFLITPRLSEFINCYRDDGERAARGEPSLLPGAAWGTLRQRFPLRLLGLGMGTNLGQRRVNVPPGERWPQAPARPAAAVG